MAALWERALSSIKTKLGPTAAAYSLPMTSRTSSRYRAAVKELRLKIIITLIIWLNSKSLLISKHDCPSQMKTKWHVPGTTLNVPSLNWTDRRTQTRGIQEYNPLICNLRRTVAGYITLPMDAVTIDITSVEVSLRFRLAKIAIYRSSTGVVTLGRQATGLRTTVCLV